MLKNNLIHDPVEHYAREVLANRIVAGRLVKLACQRHVDDRKSGHKRGLFWDLEAALRVINFFPDVLLLPETGSPFYLEPWSSSSSVRCSGDRDQTAIAGSVPPIFE
jgi:phage terminase large subunit-like protein